ncbi:putative bidirectional sugar transporter SWEET2a [Iris pallida]|uniref:Bidirectional sugar transporter SWEET2a n=1 Tax=Iris pallida TaxID=29817 RepID=A0AAX6IAE7_IRIPA|nr:putative bidirectional sugar transporter SWEET2a [Iris pallida]
MSISFFAYGLLEHDFLYISPMGLARSWGCTVVAVCIFQQDIERRFNTTAGVTSRMFSSRERAGNLRRKKRFIRCIFFVLLVIFFFLLS